MLEIISKDGQFEIINSVIERFERGDASKTIQNLISNLKYPCTALNTSISGKGTLIRFINMPRMSLDFLKNSFAIEADKYFPFPQDQIYTDCYILNPEGKSKQMAVLAAASKKELVDERVNLIKKLDVPLGVICINSMALANALNRVGDDVLGKDDVAVLLDMGESVTNLTIMVNCMPRFTRDIYIGSKDITKRISNSFGIDENEAEKLKHNPGEQLTEVLNACEAAVMSIVREIRLSIDYFTTENNTEINSILLTGGGALLNGLSDMIQKNLDINVKNWNPLSSFKMSSEIEGKNIEVDSMKMGVALGLALFGHD